MDLSGELRKYKELLDEGVINQEDFDEKKKELLDARIKEKNRRNSSFSGIRSFTDSIVSKTTEELIRIKEKEVVTDSAPVSISDNTEYFEEFTTESDQNIERIPDSMSKQQEKKKTPIIPIAVIGFIVLTLAVVVNMGDGKLYKNRHFVASFEKVYSKYEKVVHKNLGSNITFDVSDDLGEHGYIFKYKDVAGYLIIEEDDDKTSMVTVAASYDSIYTLRKDDALDIFTTLFIACDPSIKETDIEAEIAGNMEKLINDATGYGDTESMDLYEFKGISYIFGYTHHYSSDIDVFQLAIYEPKDE